MRTYIVHNFNEEKNLSDNQLEREEGEGEERGRQLELKIGIGVCRVESVESRVKSSRKKR